MHHRVSPHGVESIGSKRRGSNESGPARSTGNTSRTCGKAPKSPCADLTFIAPNLNGTYKLGNANWAGPLFCGTLDGHSQFPAWVSENKHYAKLGNELWKIEQRDPLPFLSSMLDRS